MQLLAPDLPRHLDEQQSESVEHEPLTGTHEHSAPLAQSVSLQSENPSQSSSVPFAQEDSESGGRPQSISQEHESSAVSQLPSPQNGGGPQSISQLNPLSIPSQVRSPQQEGVAGRSLQIQSPSVEHRESLQGTAPTPPPAPQQ